MFIRLISLDVLEIATDLARYTATAQCSVSSTLSKRISAPESTRARTEGVHHSRRNLLTASIAALAVMSGCAANTALIANSVWPM